MEAHVKNYFQAFGYDKGDVILCEVCGGVSVDIHHIEPRSKFGSTRKKEQDDPTNLIALCRICHDIAHGNDSRWYKDFHKQLIEKRSLKVTKSTSLGD